jgi:regulator of cell morphogenesis and NO signaling
MNITTQTQVGTVATQHPLTTRVFARHGIDFCCGGGKPLAEACSAIGVDTDSVIAELEKEIHGAAAPETRWDEAPLGDLIEYILRHYHDSLKEELPRLEAMARKVNDVHGDKDPERFAGILRTFLAIKEDIDQHLPKEEQVLFPAILAGHRHMLGGPISVMEMEHEALGEMLRQLRSLTGDYVVPAEACNTWRALWIGLEAFERDLHEHIHLENNILHKRAYNG